MSTEIKINGGNQRAVYTHAYITWETAIDVVCKLAAQHGHEGAFSMHDAERLLQAAGHIINAKTALANETVAWTNENQATGMTPNIWVEQHPDDKKKNLQRKLHEDFR